MEHLGLEVFDRDGGNGQFSNLPENASITINDNSDIFGSGDIWSYSFVLNIRANAHIFGSSGELHGARLHDAVHKRRARLWVDGIALFYGFLLLEDDVDVDKSGNVRVSFGSGRKTLKTLIEGAKANQVPMMDDVPFGMALYRKRKVTISATLRLSCKLHSVISVRRKKGSREEVVHLVEDFAQKTSADATFDGDDAPVSEYPRMIFPRGTFYNRSANQDETLNYLNTELPYDAQHPYCNIALCYQKSKYKKNVVDSGEDGEVEEERAYTLMPADRVNSAPCFFVIYWILALMKHLNIRVDENQMMGVEDLRRLFFVNTNCAYDSPKSRGINRRTDCTHKIPPELVPEHRGAYLNANDNRYTATVTGYDVPDGADIDGLTRFNEYMTDGSAHLVGIQSYSGGNTYKKDNSYAHIAYASSECFPNSDVSTVIESIESAFGIRFLFDRDYSSVRIILLRNIFRNSDVQRIACDITNDDGKTESSIRGFRMTYGTSDNTHFYYKGFADALVHKTELWPDNSDTHDYSKWDLNAQYAEVLKKKSAFNLTCYITPNNGNAWIVKNDEQAERLSEYYPEIFECAGFMDAEDGDCSGEDDTIHTVSVGFTPAIMNEISKTHQDGALRFALFCEDEMRPRRYNYKNPNDGEYFSSPTKAYDAASLYAALGVAAAGGKVVKPGCFEVFTDAPGPSLSATSRRYWYLSDRQTLWDHLDHYGFHPEGMTNAREYGISFKASGFLVEGYRLYLQDNFEPNDEGISPIEKHDWGLTLGILRGSGTDARVQPSEDPDDGEGNVTWDIVPGKNVTAHPDTCDNYGNLWVHENSHIIFTPEQAIGQMQEMFPNSNFNLANTATTAAHSLYLAGGIPDKDGNNHRLLLAVPDGMSSWEAVRYFRNRSVQDMWDYDSNGRRLLIAIDATQEQLATLSKLRNIAKGSGESITIDGDGVNAVWAQQNRISLKLRAEKPNPKFDRTQPESDENRRYLKIENSDLSGRGLCDQFYKEFSWWIRNGRTQKYTLHMELAQLLTIDKSVQVQVGDVTGFIKKMKYTVSNATGLGLVTMEILYI